MLVVIADFIKQKKSEQQTATLKTCSFVIPTPHAVFTTGESFTLPSVRCARFKRMSVAVQNNS